MYINSLGMGGAASHTQKNSGAGTADVKTYRYDTAMRKALEKRNAAVGSASVQEGDMIITQPSCYQKSGKQQSVSAKEKSGMTMSGYRQWFRGEVAAVQAEAYARSPYLSDTLVIKEDAFERMKSDPAWEKEVLSKIKEHCYGKEIAGTKAIGCQVIGVSPEDCHEERIPVKTSASGISALYPSFYAGSSYAANPLLTQSGYWNTILAGQNGLSNYLTQGLLSGQSSLGTLASAAYGNVMNGGLSNSLLGNFLL
ncbi:MAG: DUF868 family protein [Blautia sp.]|nr:DUF868 family protein [Blautia sp.]MCM1200628.1 DUF868 family protein [Bacteroides fragilis]